MDPDDSLLSRDGVVVDFTSFNFSPLSWGIKVGSPCIRIIRNTSCHQKFKVMHHSSSTKMFGLKAVGGNGNGLWLFLEPDSRELILGQDRTTFKFELVDVMGDQKFLLRLCTKEKLYVRHSNYLLRADPEKSTDKPWSEDSLWFLRIIDSISDTTAASTPIGENPQICHKPLFIHKQNCFSTRDALTESLSVLGDFVDDAIFQGNSHSRLSKGMLPYSLQGAGGSGMAKATAISMLRPGLDVSEDLQRRIEAASTVKSRGGMKSFSRPSPAVARCIDYLSRIAIKEMKRMKMFGLTNRREFELELGFCEWVNLPEGSEISPHRDGGSDCDVAAIFGIRNKAICTVERTPIVLDTGNMYIFEPQKYVHSVGKPLEPGPRIVVALRFFRVSS